MFKKFLCVLVLPLALASCHQPSSKQAAAPTNAKSAIPKVTLQQADGRFQILRDGQPYFVKGGGGSGDLSLLKACGGNSVRTWSTDKAEKTLADAQRNGLTVMLGLSMGIERHGFNYSDAAAVKAQKEMIRAEVLKYKDHPALLAWGLGNELDLFYKNTDVWYAVEDLAKMIKELDPNHLVTTVVAGISAEKLALIKARVPSIDYLSINIYGGLETLPKSLAEMKWNGPYMVTEWGPTGHWEIAKTAWGIPIEQTSTEKAKSYRERYEGGILGAPGRALGSYAFLWGQKQETTPTWYGVFLESGEATEVVDSLQFLWTGSWPENRAPSIRTFLLDGKTAAQNIYLMPGKIYPVKADVVQQDNQTYSVRWEALPESTDIRAGGDAEARPKAVENIIVKDDGKGGMEFKAPATPGAYRLFVYAITDHKKAAVANIPFYVR